MNTNSKWFYIFCLFCLISFSACHKQQNRTAQSVFSEEVGNLYYDLSEIQSEGEMIVLTLYGPDTYYEFRGVEFGNQFKLAEAFGQSIGVKTRVEVCRNENELVQKLMNGQGDLIAYDLNVDSIDDKITLCGENELTPFLEKLARVEHDPFIHNDGNVAWAVRNSSTNLAGKLQEWMTKNKNHFFYFSQPLVRNVNDHRSYVAKADQEYFPDIPDLKDYPDCQPHGNSYSYNGYEYPGVDYSGGDISRYDRLFQKYAPTSGLDWKMLAAMARNESDFNPQAVSYMGARGLMQLMPSTAQQYGVSNPFDPEQSVKGATKLLNNLMDHYSDVQDYDERVNFAIAAYNAGQGHVDDARRLAAKHGKNNQVWKGNVDEYVLYMSNPDYYNDPVVKYGYFRGGETYNYVNYIRSDYKKYKSR